MREPAKFKVDENQAAQTPAEEQKVNSVPLISDPQSFLGADKREILAKFQEEVFEVPNQSPFELAF